MESDFLHKEQTCYTVLDMKSMTESVLSDTDTYHMIDKTNYAYVPCWCLEYGYLNFAWKYLPSSELCSWIRNQIIVNKQQQIINVNSN